MDGLEDEVVAHGFVPEVAGGNRASARGGGDPQVGGASPVQVQGVADGEAGDGLGGEGGEGGGQTREGGGVGVAEAPGVVAVPEEKGPGTGGAGGETPHRLAILQEEGAGLEQFLWSPGGVPGLPGGAAHDAVATGGWVVKEDPGGQG